MKKLKRFLLIDDSRATNFFNKTIIEKVQCVEEVFIAENGKQALDYIQSEIIPEIIFLDINMPVMDGWEFIAEYQKLDDKYKGSVIILMLGTELSKEDEEKAAHILEIKEYAKKMLTKEIVCKIVMKYFSLPELDCCSESHKNIV
ncbi:CheY-like chemotaxis protein [Aquimarina sp. MAR_2010_214]|uniref:response regulator n=1 Tax=Aquimarina sp. MAR_2010_214 TaxID=1250026 RepID=UPI000C70138C|nr:response regulator [Aquimarina sp. MAR_2010_214]PKV51965.1 CheY-like chemotaxis protein [Aquimarina sp. MAR_2010_214]